MGRGVYASPPGAASQGFEKPLELASDFGMLAPVRHGRLKVTELRPAVIPGTLEAVRQHSFLGEQGGDGVGELDFAPRAGPRLRKMMKNARRQYVPPDHGQSRRRRLRLRLLDDSHDSLDARGDG